MEYIDAPTASKESIQALSEDEQLQLVQSTRHGIRILQYADISQHDWHRQQILICRHESSVHRVFIDFAACTQSLGGWQEHTSDDVGGSAYSLIGNGVLSQEWVAQVYGHREVWDRWANCPQELEKLYYQPDSPFMSVLGSWWHG
ncbi:hypothetical protein QCA50_008269 [Cerrena zonata]|uniref:Uncharacterized protein n=1 Tax=Cerrena zonata TaxID=2478898 RepID=A0AAW0GC51_9APHY